MERKYIRSHRQQAIWVAEQGSFVPLQSLSLSCIYCHPGTHVRFHFATQVGGKRFGGIGFGWRV